MNVNKAKLLLFIAAILEHVSRNRTCSIGKLRTHIKKTCDHRTVEDPGFAIRTRPRLLERPLILVLSAFFLSGRDGVYFCRRCDRDSVCLVWRAASQHSRKHRAYACVGSHHLQLMQVREKKLVSDFQTFSIIIFTSTINVRIVIFFNFKINMTV